MGAGHPNNSFMITHCQVVKGTLILSDDFIKYFIKYANEKTTMKFALKLINLL